MTFCDYSDTLHCRVMAFESFTPTPFSEPQVFRLAELDRSEKQDIDSALRTIILARETSNATYPVRGDESIEGECRANQKIASYGPRVLPYLAEKAKEGQLGWYQYSLYLRALGESQNINSVLELVEETPELTQMFDASAIYGVSGYLAREIYDFRRGSNIRKLQNIVKRLSALIEQGHVSENAERALFQPLALTGLPEAKTFIEHKGGWSDYLEGLFRLPDQEFIARSFSRHHFATWEEVSAQRAQVRRLVESPVFHGGLAIDEYNDSFGDGADSLMIMNDELPLQGASSLDEPYNPFVSDAEAASQERFDRCLHVLDFLKDRTDLELTALPALKMHLYNYLTAHRVAFAFLDTGAVTAYLEGELQRVRRLSEMEREYAEAGNPLPTIGIEIEIPQESVRDKVPVLKQLGIPNQAEMDDLWEVNPKFSYSPWAQARILQELVVMGAIPVGSKQVENANFGKISSEPLSLHVNFGLAEEVKAYAKKFRDGFDNEATVLNDALVYAFTSPDRLYHRKTNMSFLLQHDAAGTKKTQDKGSVTAESENHDRGLKLYRLELRANEFKDFPTFRMLAESQRLAAAFSAYIKMKDGASLSKLDIVLAAVWQHFKDRFFCYTRKISATT